VASPTDPCGPDRNSQSSIRNPHSPWAALFDFDDTLADTLPFRIACWEHALRTHSQELFDVRDFLARTVGEPLERQVARHAPSADLATAMVAAYREHYYGQHLRHLRLYPGVREMLEGVRAAGGAIAVVSSKLRAGVEAEVVALGLGDLVAVVVGPEDTDLPKPDPAPARFALERLDLPPDRALFIGDSALDIECGRAAGTRTVAAHWGCLNEILLRAADADFEAHDPPTVLTIARRLFDTPEAP
jgi:pyrophosphatase PpaX